MIYKNQGSSLVVPDSLRHKVLYHSHDAKKSDHLGQTKTLGRLKDKFYWYSMTKDTILYVQQCAVCNTTKKLSVTPTSPSTKVSCRFSFGKSSIRYHWTMQPFQKEQCLYPCNGRPIN